LGGATFFNSRPLKRVMIRAEIVEAVKGDV
jgi:hypothetical protein